MIVPKVAAYLVLHDNLICHHRCGTVPSDGYSSEILVSSVVQNTIGVGWLNGYSQGRRLCLAKAINDALSPHKSDYSAPESVSSDPVSVEPHEALDHVELLPVKEKLVPVEGFRKVEEELVPKDATTAPEPILAAPQEVTETVQYSTDEIHIASTGSQSAQRDEWESTNYSEETNLETESLATEVHETRSSLEYGDGPIEGGETLVKSYDHEYDTLKEETEGPLTSSGESIPVTLGGLGRNLFGWT